MPRIALYAGSFDPVTNGHLDIVRQAARLADRLVLAIGVHPGKSPIFTAQERLEMLEEVCRPVARETSCEIGYLTFDGLDRAAERLGRRTCFVPSRGPLAWRARRTLARLRLGRAPAAFGVWVAQ